MKDKNSLPLIMVNDVDYVYSNGTVALNQISLNINHGELLAIMGQNGAGNPTYKGKCLYRWRKYRFKNYS